MSNFDYNKYLIDYNKYLIDYNKYLIEISTYRPPVLDYVDETILRIIGNRDSCSVYQAFKDLTESHHTLIKKSLDYTNVLKRIKRFEELNLVERLKKQFERGAIHYKVTTYGLISCLESEFSIFDIIKKNKENIVIKTLLDQVFEERTIDSLPKILIESYIRECCLATEYCCVEWTQAQFFLSDILPSDKIIQQYMSYLMNIPIENKQSVLNEIEAYDKKLQRRIKDPKMKRISEIVERYSKDYTKSTSIGIKELLESNHLDKRPPFPFLNLYYWIIIELQIQLQRKLRDLSFEIVWDLGHNIKEIEIGSLPKQDIIESQIDILPENLYLPEREKTIINDKKFNYIIDEIDFEYQIGIRQFDKRKTKPSAELAESESLEEIYKIIDKYEKPGQTTSETDASKALKEIDQVLLNLRPELESENENKHSIGVEEYIEELVSKKYIRYDPKTKLYSVTEKGKKHIEPTRLQLLEIYFTSMSLSQELARTTDSERIRFQQVVKTVHNKMKKPV